ncbi:hypothetical protein [Sphingorhabdus sp. Alg231-15]|uniref:hypothetical protein n=1 Tax=Sphingorhabdus sp. Alg231-15 TaxID=1922222 RepID=UPI000D5529F2
MVESHKMLAHGCAWVFFVLFVMPISVEFALPTISNYFGPKLEDYCKKENLVKIYNAELYELRRNEVENKGAPVTPGWKTIISERNEAKVLYNSIRTRTATLFFNDNKVAQTRFYSLDRENIITLIGWAPPNGTPCKIASDFRLKHAIIIEAYDDSRFPPKEYR